MSQREHMDDSADVVIVGTGAGGATAARVLSAAGLRVVMIEEGPRLDTRKRARGVLDAMSESMRDLATIATSGRAPMPLLLGRCVGGSTAVNSGIIWRLPELVRAHWAQQHGLQELLDEAQLDRVFTQLETELGIAEVPEHLRGGNADLLRVGSAALGLSGRVIRRNAPHCVGRAQCLQGCPEGARQSMDVSYVPRALEHGARLHSLARATRIVIEGGRAHGVIGDLLDPHTRKVRGRFSVHARRAVIVAASAIHTPLLLWRSGLRRNVGDNYQAHPGVAVLGRFDHAVRMSYGATQAYEVPLFDRGVKLESLALPPELLAARLPDAGDDWQHDLAELDHFAQFCAIMRMRARGQVRPGLLGGVRVRYQLQADDLRRLRESVALLIRTMFAAGAREVFPGIAGLPERMTRPAQADAVLSDALPAHAFHVMASHHFGTAAAGADPRTSVVSPALAVHDVAQLYVMDASVLPTNLGVNPQHSIMALAFRAAERLANASHPSLRAA